MEQEMMNELRFEEYFSNLNYSEKMDYLNNRKDKKEEKEKNKIILETKDEVGNLWEV